MNELPIDLLRTIFRIRGGYAWAGVCAKFRNCILDMTRVFSSPYEIYGLRRKQERQLKYLQLCQPPVQWYCTICSQIALAPVCEDCSSYNPFIDVPCQVTVNHPSADRLYMTDLKIRYLNPTGHTFIIGEIPAFQSSKNGTPIKKTSPHSSNKL